MFGLDIPRNEARATIVQGLIALLFSIFVLFTPLLAILAVATSKRDAEPSPDSQGGHPIRRGWARWPFKWWQTPDEALPGGTYEKTVAEIYEKHGYFWTSLYWIWLRNRGHYFRKYFAELSDEPSYLTRFPEIGGVAKGVRDDGSWYFSWRFLKVFKFVTGHRVYKLPGDVYAAVPTFTVKLEKPEPA